MKIRGNANANAIVGVALLVVGAFALLVGMDTPATGADRIVIRTDDGRTIHDLDVDIDPEELEEFAEKMAEWSEDFGEEIAAIFEDMEFDFDNHWDADHDVHVRFDSDEFARHMDHLARELEHSFGGWDERDFEHLGARIERNVERAVREAERHARRVEVRGDRWRDREERRDRDRRDWSVDDRDEDEAREIRREIEGLQRELERLQRRLERIDG